MKLQVTLNSTYKWALVEELYELELTPAKISEICQNFEVDSINELEESQLGELALNGECDLVENTIIQLENCKHDQIMDASIIKD